MSENNNEFEREDIIPEDNANEQPADAEVSPFSDDAPEYHTPYVDIPVIDESEAVNKRGLKVFLCVLCVVLILSIFTSIGYFLGSIGGNKGNLPDVNLAARPADTDMMTAAEVYNVLDKSVVGVTAYNSTKMISGSGVIYSKDGYVVINDSLYSNIAAAKFKVYDYQGNEYSAEFVAGDTRSDIAVIKITDKVSLTPAVFGTSDGLYYGEPIVAVGRPTGAETANNITTGIISVPVSRQSLNTTYSMKYIQIDAALNPGSNGGAVSNMYGQVIGVICTKVASDGYEGMGFVIPSKTVSTVVDSLVKNGFVEDRARLGISYTEINSVQAEAQNITKGLYVAEVSKDSDAYGKIVVGDVITAVNGKKLKSAEDLLDLIEESVPGDSLVFTVVHKNGSTDDITAKLIPDKGSSSYHLYEDDFDDSDNTDSEYNTSEFDFPYGD